MIEMLGTASVSRLKGSTKEQHRLSVYQTFANNLAQDTVGPRNTQISVQLGDMQSSRERSYQKTDPNLNSGVPANC